MFAKDGGVRLYNYHQDLNGQYGDGGKVRQKRYRFPKNKWISVSLHVRVNKDLKGKDGFTKLYIDGQLIVDGGTNAPPWSDFEAGQEVPR